MERRDAGGFIISNELAEKMDSSMEKNLDYETKKFIEESLKMDDKSPLTKIERLSSIKEIVVNELEGTIISFAKRSNYGALNYILGCDQTFNLEILKELKEKLEFSENSIYNELYREFFNHIHTKSKRVTKMTDVRVKDNCLEIYNIKEWPNK